MTGLVTVPFTRTLVVDQIIFSIPFLQIPFFCYFASNFVLFNSLFWASDFLEGK
jgi:hypothetical protein